VWTNDIERILASMPFRELIHRVARSYETIFPVINAQDWLTGIFTLHDVGLPLKGAEWGLLVLADDPANAPVFWSHRKTTCTRCWDG
jgi:chloride channel protein, CIC family